MKAILRPVLAVLAGLAVMLVLLIVVEGVAGAQYPLPENFQGTKEEMCAHVEGYPQWILAWVVPAWAFIGLAAAWTARRIGNVYSAGVVGLLMLLALISNQAMLPYPIWFEVSNLILIPLALVAGTYLAGRRKSPRTAHESAEA
jgi:hypothetical protein